MHQITQLNRRVLHGALVRLERSAAKVARCVLRGEGSREAPDLPGGRISLVNWKEVVAFDWRSCFREKLIGETVHS